MQLSELAVGLGFLLIVEGLPLFLSPRGYRRLLMRVEQVPDPLLRVIGMTAMCGGLALLYLLK